MLLERVLQRGDCERGAVQLVGRDAVQGVDERLCCEPQALGNGPAGDQFG